MPELDHVAAEKFGSVKLTGTKEFKQQVIDVAIAKNLNIVFDLPKLQQMFIEQKLVHEQKQVTENKQDNIVDKPVHSNEQQQNRGLKKEVEDNFTLVRFDSAPYLNDKISVKDEQGKDIEQQDKQEIVKSLKLE
uniref:LPD7 domain-containing protein n=1 Tax=Candidatus Enterovibrio escicola TaxID=1927127 RepID=UPI001CC22849|nr:LPD7 domain-containing protein [Candidatus Enterovibrio escacola]